MNNSNSIVSVIMSVFNAEDKVSNAIESIINQTYENIEFLIIDDASTDNSLNIIKKYQKKDKRINLILNSKNIGLTKSLNKLIKISNGEYIARQDADDYSRNDRIEKQIYYINKYNLDFCSSRARTIQKNNKIPGWTYYLPISLVMKFKNPFIHGTLLIRKNVLESVENYDEKYYYSQDYRLMLQLLNKKINFKIINQDLYFLNIVNNISTLKKNEQKYYFECAKKNINPNSFYLESS